MTLATEQATVAYGSLWKRADDEEGSFSTDGAPGVAWLEDADDDRVTLYVGPAAFARDSSMADTTLWLTRHEAMRLMAALGKAVLA